MTSSAAAPPLSRGVLVSLGSSVSFAILYFATPMLAPLPAEAIWAVRAIITLPFVGLTLLAMRRRSLIAEVGALVRRRPLALLGILFCGLMLSAQLWVFGWAPLHGRGLQVALGYFLLPLVLVIIGKFLYRDHLRWWQWFAAGVAALGVVWEIVRMGGVSWETLLVALGYPVYFVLRRSLGTGHIGGMFWELLTVLPLAAVVLGIEIASGTAFAEHANLRWSAPLFALCSAFALLLYILASKLLSMSLFGLLSYAEPALLVVASLLLGETIASGEWPTYIAIWIAVLILVVGGLGELLRARRTRLD